LLDDLAWRYAAMRQPITRDSGVEVRYSCRPLALKRALSNLIDNALKHAGEASISLGKEPDGQIRLEILDLGPVIEQAWL
ncbi:ATP-binding protein, partial [Pseudomonas syringae group genomosp. 7]|uniref:ATP-binding protein n=1 Tax=Pseudomonas syringae group genomosp. 7 TaxID=251699 RepID=UPI003770075E